MKEHWSVSKEKLVNLEEGLTLESEPTGLKVVRERRSTCNVLVQYVKLILYIEFALLIGWACYSLWQTYRIESMEVKVGDLIGKPHREIVIGSIRENDPIKSDQMLDLPAASDIALTYKNILHKNDGSLEQMIDNLGIEKEKSIIVDENANRKQGNDDSEWYVKLDTTARPDSKQEFIKGHPESFVETDFSPVEKASVEDLQPLDRASETTTDSVSDKKDSVDTDNDLYGKSTETEESSAIDSNVQDSEKIWPDIVSESSEEKVKDSDETREREFPVYSQESESSGESKAESEFNEMTSAKYSHLVITGEALEPFKWLFQDSESSEESTSEGSDAKLDEEDGSVDKSTSMTDDSVERMETEDSEHNWGYESTESIADTLHSHERWFSRDDKVSPSKGANDGLWEKFLKDLDKYSNEDGSTDTYEYVDKDRTAPKETQYINNMSEDMMSGQFSDEESYSMYDLEEEEYLRMLGRWPPNSNNDRHEQSTPLLDRVRDDGEQKYSLEDSSFRPLNSRFHHPEEMIAEVSDSSDSNIDALPWGTFTHRPPISIDYPRNSKYLSLGTRYSEMDNEEDHHLSPLPFVSNAPTSERKRVDELVKVQWPWFEKTEPGGDDRNSNEMEMAVDDLRGITATVTHSVLGFSADGIDLLKCTMDIVEGIISPVVCEPFNSATTASDLYGKTIEKEDNRCGSGEYYHFTGICLPYSERDSLHEPSSGVNTVPTTEVSRKLFDDDSSTEIPFINFGFTRSEEQDFVESDRSNSESKMIPGDQNVETSGMTINDDGIRIWKGLNVEDSELKDQLDSVLRLLLSETDSDESQGDFKVGIDDDDISPVISEIKSVMQLNGAFILIRDSENEKAQLYRNQNSRMEHTDDEFELPKISNADPDTEWEYIKPFYYDDTEDMPAMIRKRRATINVPPNLDESRNNPVMQLVFRNFYDAAAKAMQQVPREQAMNDVDFQKFADKMEFLAAHIDRLHKRYLHHNELKDDYVSMEFPAEDY